MLTGDEVKKVRTRVPRSIAVAAVSNAIMLFAFVLCILFTIGDVDKVTNTPTGVPLIEVYYQATKSKPATNFLTILPAIVIFFSLFNAFASVSRLVWQFSRDNGLPFSKTFAYVCQSIPFKRSSSYRLTFAGPSYHETPSKCIGISGHHHFSLSNHFHPFGNCL